MKRSWVIFAFGFIEIAIGVIALAAEFFRLFSEGLPQPFSVRIFVITAAVISLILGVGIIRRNFTAYRYLIVFSGIVVLSKVLAFFRIITISTALGNSLHQPHLNFVSVVYHSCLILYFYRSSMRKEFRKR